MTKKIIKVSIITEDNGKIDTTHLQESNVKSINWKKLGKQIGECMPSVMPI